MKNDCHFTSQDLRQIKALGLSKRDVERQIAVYAKGPTWLKLDRPCTQGDGILSLTPAQRKKLILQFETEAGNYMLLKFVPASGAASRMFGSWFIAAAQGSFGNAGLDRSFLSDLRKMPFISLLEKHDAACLMISQKNVRAVLEYILLSTGLHFSWLPKALIPFHVYHDGEARTALEEHLVEAAGFMKNNSGICRLHFTISPEHAKTVRALLKLIIPRYEERYQVRFKIDLSLQLPLSNIVAVDENGQPFRDDGGHLVFRPGGHGALLKNLQDLDADLIFIKNIDNIVPEALQKKILPYKKMLGGLALQLRNAVFTILRRLENAQLTDHELQYITDFCQSELHMSFPKGFSKLSRKEKKRQLFLHLNRPLRICGVVKNVGEPGGGPFWVQEKDKSQTLQIVESAHVDHRRAAQKKIWSQASYFNPVDMVCCTKNYLGKKFRLSDHVNHDAYLISPKMEKGRHLKAQELPGLWNGGMAYWNTVFVELPLTVFNPVKTVYDLLRPQHRSGRFVK